MNVYPFRSILLINLPTNEYANILKIICIKKRKKRLFINHPQLRVNVKYLKNVSCPVNKLFKTG